MSIVSQMWERVLRTMNEVERRTGKQSGCVLYARLFAFGYPDWMSGLNVDVFLLQGNWVDILLNANTHPPIIRLGQSGTDHVVTTRANGTVHTTRSSCGE